MTEKAIEAAYAAYDKDKRANGLSDFEAFRDAILMMSGLRDLDSLVPSEAKGISNKMSPERAWQIHNLVRNMSPELDIAQAIKELNLRGNFTDAEWTVLIFQIGYSQAGGI